jgi:4-hydroxy-tetrahydrodipicolinate synthase
MEEIPMSALTGLICPNLTPFNKDLSIAMDLYIEHANRMLDAGCSALAPFGTTGEALSIGMDERMEVLEAMVDAGIDPAKLVPGTGLTNLQDTAKLCSHAIEMKCAGVMVLPPFYYKGVSDEALFQYFSALIGMVNSPALKIYLYHIPPVAQVPVSVELTARLAKAFPGTVVGIKDSSGDWNNTKRLLTEVKDIAIFPGSENPLIDALALGAPGCISATANINAENIIRCYKAAGTPEAARLQQQIRAYRQPFQDLGAIPAQKWMLAHQTGEPRWKIVRPPLLALSDEKGKELLKRLETVLEPAD